MSSTSRLRCAVLVYLTDFVVKSHRTRTSMSNVYTLIRILYMYLHMWCGRYGNAAKNIHTPANGGRGRRGDTSQTTMKVGCDNMSCEFWHRQDAMYEYVDFCMYASSSIFMPISCFSLWPTFLLLSFVFVDVEFGSILRWSAVCGSRCNLHLRCRASSAPVVLIFQLVDGQRVGKILTLVIASPFVSPRPLFEPTRHYRSKNNRPFRHHFEKGPQLTPGWAEAPLWLAFFKENYHVDCRHSAQENISWPGNSPILKYRKS